MYVSVSIDCIWAFFWTNWRNAFRSGAVWIRYFPIISCLVQLYFLENHCFYARQGSHKIDDDSGGLCPVSVVLSFLSLLLPLHIIISSSISFFYKSAILKLKSNSKNVSNSCPKIIIDFKATKKPDERCYCSSSCICFLYFVISSNVRNMMPVFTH